MKNLGKISILLLILIFTLSFGQVAKVDFLVFEKEKIQKDSLYKEYSKLKRIPRSESLKRPEESKQTDSLNRREESKQIENEELKLFDKTKISFTFFFNGKARFNIDGKTVEIREGDSLAIGTIDGRVYKGKVLSVNERSVYVDTFIDGIAVRFKPNSDPVFYYKTRTIEMGDIEKLEVTPVAKPIIYLYPEKKTEVNVKLSYKGTFTSTYPKYPENGWTVTAKPDGTLKDKSGKEYYSLFWEGVTDRTFTLDEGFIIKNEDAAAFLEKSLKTLGLNFREANEFIIFWLPELEKHPYNLIHFSTKKYEELAKLTVTPAPDTVIRVFMVFKGLDKLIEVKPQTLVSKVRKGFTVVEWGGSEIKNEAKSVIR